MVSFVTRQNKLEGFQEDLKSIAKDNFVIILQMAGVWPGKLS